METLITLIGLIVVLLVIAGLYSIEQNTKKTNVLLRLILKDKNPENYSLTKRGKLKDNKTGKTV